MLHCFIEIQDQKTACRRQVQGEPALMQLGKPAGLDYLCDAQSDSQIDLADEISDLMLNFTAEYPFQ